MTRRPPATATPAPDPAPGTLSARDFNRIRKLAFDYCGLNLEAGKEHLVAARLAAPMRSLNLSSFSDYFDHVLADRTSNALVAMIDSLTTNHTSFFREQQHFDFLASTLFPALAGRTHIALWSAACSTGEEPYSLAFAARDFFEHRRPAPEIRILATDISTRVLETAARATYEARRFHNHPVAGLNRHLLRGAAPHDHLYRVKPDVRAMVHFRRLNLTEPFPTLGSLFPLILCRNVMIYFTPETQQQLVQRLFDQLEPGGFLFIGHSESLNRITHPFDYVHPAIYRKPGTLKPT